MKTVNKISVCFSLSILVLLCQSIYLFYLPHQLTHSQIGIIVENDFENICNHSLGGSNLDCGTSVKREKLAKTIDIARSAFVSHEEQTLVNASRMITETCALGSLRTNPDLIDIILSSEKSNYFFLNQWQEFFQGFHFIIIYSGEPTSDFEIPEWVDYHLYTLSDIPKLIGEDAWIFTISLSSQGPSFNHFGYLVSNKKFVMTFDDTFSPKRDNEGYLINPIAVHLTNLQSSCVGFSKAISTHDSSSFSYDETLSSGMNTCVSTVISQGTSYRDQEMQINLTINREVQNCARIVPYKSSHNMRSNNIAFSRSRIGPALMTGLHGHNCPFAGFGDFFAGLASRAIVDHFKEGVKTGSPTLLTEQTYQTWNTTNSQKIWEDFLIQFFYHNVTFSPDCTTAQAAYLELSDQISTFLSPIHSYFSVLTKAMKTWVTLWEKFEFGMIVPHSSLQSKNSTSVDFVTLNRREKSHHPDYFHHQSKIESREEDQNLQNFLTYWGFRDNESVVTSTDLRIGRKWKTYIYDLPHKFHRDISERFGIFGCIDKACSEGEISNLPNQYTDHAAEIVILRKLVNSLDFVTDPALADLVLVPTLGVSALWYFTPNREMRGCRNFGVCMNDFFADLESRLIYLNTSKKHLFLSTQDSSQNHLFFRVQSLRRNCLVADLGPGKLVVPSLNPNMDFQPFYWNGPVKLEDRSIFVLANYGVRFVDRITAYNQLTTYNGSKTVEFNRVKNSHIGSNVVNYTKLMNSVFILCFTGDLPYTKRIYDAWIAVSIPVVVPFFHTYGKSYFADEESHSPHPDFSPTITNSFPQIRNFSYSDIVIEIPRGFLLNGSMMEFLEGISNEDIQEKLSNIEKIRNFFLYDLKGSSDDAFTVMLQNVGVWLGKL